MDLLHNLDFYDNSVFSPDRAYKLRPLFDHLSRTFKEHGTIGEHLSISESMIPYYGKHYSKQFIGGKPIRFGCKMWAICSEGGYLHAFDMFKGKNGLENQANDKLGLVGYDVIKLVDETCILSSSGNKVFFDNYFTSISLMERLLEKGVYASGTCRSNRTENFPLINEAENFKNKLRRTAVHKISEDVLLFKWKNNKDVILVSNFKATEIKSTKRWSKESKKYIDVPQPACISNYNKYMGFVDQMAQCCSIYRIRMRIGKW